VLAEDGLADGVLVVRASGASAARAALEGTPPGRTGTVQLVLRVPSGRLPNTAVGADFPGCAVEIQPAGIMMLTIAVSRLSIDIAELQPLMFQPVRVERPLAVLFASSVGQLLAVRDVGDELVDPHGGGHYLIGLAELVLRSALRTHLHRADVAAARCREAIEYVQRHLADPELTADRVADALFISRRRLYQLFDDGDGISGRIRRLRIERAKELLADPTRGRYGIGELSRQCGFINSAHFSRTFRKIVGQTPREFREKALSDGDTSVGREVDRGDQPAEDR
jgi:AraC-like DNA-binding protein